MRGVRHGVAGAVVSLGIVGATLLAGPASVANVDPTSTTVATGPTSVPTTTVVGEGDAAVLEFVEGPELSCDPTITEVTDTYRVTKAPWATDLIVVPEIVANGVDLVFTPAELGPGVTTATASVTYPTPGGFSGRGASGLLIALNADRTPASSGDVNMGFVGSIYCPSVPVTVPPTTSVPAGPTAPAATPLAAAATYTG